MIGDSNVEDQDQGVSLVSKVLEGVEEKKIEFVTNSIIPVPCISDPIEQQYVGNIEELQEKLILHSSPTVEKPSLQINKLAFTMLETGSTDNNKQPMMSSEISQQPYSDFQVAENDNHYHEEVFIYSFIDPFADYLESLSSSNVNFFMSKEGWSCCPFELHISILWFSTFIVFRSRDLPTSQILVWLHWKHDFT
jgi:hypothetical protein